jgi:hypothetical protein
VNMIRHNDMAADCYVVLLCAFAKGTEGLLDFSTRERMQSACVLKVTK